MGKAIRTFRDLDKEKDVIGICVSGGLDSKTVTKRLIEEGFKVICFTANLGQPDEKDINDVAVRMATCGAETIIVDLRNEMAEACFGAIRDQAKYDGGYWNTTGIARAVTVLGLIKAMIENGITVLAHGATGRGNDQMRFEAYAKGLKPDMKVYAPWRDPILLKEFPGRTQMAEYLKSHGIEAEVGEKKLYSTDANLAGLSHEAGNLESMKTPMNIVEPTMGVRPYNASEKAEFFDITFEDGRAIAINKKTGSPLSIMETANLIGGRNGIGIKHALENRMLGTKSRGVYEAPGMELLGACLAYLYQAVMDKHATQLFKTLSDFIGRQIYEARYFDTSTWAAREAIKRIAEHANGIVKVILYKGNINFVSLDCPDSLYNEADASMEESEGLNPESAQGVAEVLSAEVIAKAKAGQINTR